MRESIEPILEVEEVQEEITTPLAIISRSLKLQKGKHVTNDEHRVFPIFKEKPNQISLDNSLKILATETYGIVNGDKVTVFERYKVDPISETNYSGISSEPAQTFTPKSLH